MVAAAAAGLCYPSLAHAQPDEPEAAEAEDPAGELEPAEDEDAAAAEADDAEADAFFEEFMGSVARDKADRERCADTRDTVSKKEQYDACTRLIEDAPNENDLVGSYYVNRATAFDDHTAQCQDVTKGVTIIERSNSSVFGTDFLAAAKSLQKAACY